MSNEQTEALPEGMVPWAGGDSAPEDYDGGLVLLRDGSEIWPKGIMDWMHLDNGADIIAYTPKRATPSPAPSDTLREPWMIALTYALSEADRMESIGAMVKSADLRAALKALGDSHD